MKEYSFAVNETVLTWVCANFGLSRPHRKFRGNFAKLLPGPTAGRLGAAGPIPNKRPPHLLQNSAASFLHAFLQPITCGYILHGTWTLTPWKDKRSRYLLAALPLFGLAVVGSLLFFLRAIHSRRHDLHADRGVM